MKYNKRLMEICLKREDIITDGKKVINLITKNNIGDSPTFREIFENVKFQIMKSNLFVE